MVCDGDEIVGILVDSDAAGKRSERTRETSSTDFHKVMQTPPYVRPKLMVDYDVGGLPVISRKAD